MTNDLSGKTILVVDDEADLRSIIAEDLELIGAWVLQASNGRAALELCRKENVDAVVSDVRMPGGDGIAFAKMLREEEKVFPCFIFITGFADITPEQANAIGVQGMLYKPFSLKELRRILCDKLMS